MNRDQLDALDGAAAAEQAIFDWEQYPDVPWDHWLTMPRWNSREAALLSVGHDPNTNGVFPSDPRYPIFESRWKIIQRWEEVLPSEGGLKHLRTETWADGTGTEKHPAFLFPPVDFAVLAVRLNWDVPRELCEYAVRKTASDQDPDHLRPHWIEWRARPLVLLWEAAALSLDIDPLYLRTTEDILFDDDGLTDHIQLKGQFQHAERSVIDAIHMSLDSRFETLRRSCIAKKIRAQGWGDIGVDTTVFAESVIEYCDTVGLKMPDEWRSQKPLATAVETRWPWGDYETVLLRALADAVKQWWSTYDPANPATAPSNEDVASYLQKKYPSIGETLAANIATVIRADGAPRGRRRKTE